MKSRRDQVEKELLGSLAERDQSNVGAVTYDEWQAGFNELLKVLKHEHIGGPMLEAIYQLDDSCC